MNELWEGILQLKEAVERDLLTLQYCCINYQTGSILLNQLPDDKENFIKIVLIQKKSILVDQLPTISLENYSKLHFYNTKTVPSDTLLFLKKYLLFPFLMLKADKEKRAISIAHLAQTIDGKIATKLGHSKWIGNEENLIHAHRMRALCNGVLVGSHTLKTDEPKLTVRHVKGTNPIRIIVGNPPPQFDSLLKSGDAPILTLHHKPITVDPNIQYHQFEACKGQINTKEVLEFLYKKGIKTIYIEGGAKTISYFFENSDIDILQLHLAPMIFGSGTNGLQIPNVQTMEDAYTFTHHHFLPIGDTMMFTGFR